METPPSEITTHRLEVRSFRRRDTEPLLEAVRESLTELHAWLPWAHLAYGRTDAIRFVRETGRAWREGKAYDYAIRPIDDPTRHVGNVSIWHVSRAFRAGEIGYWVRTSDSGLGYGTEAAAALVRVGFETLGLHRIMLRIAVGNDASERVATKLGFVKEGVLRDELQVHGTWMDHTVWGMLEHEYRRRGEEFDFLTGGPAAQPSA